MDRMIQDVRWSVRSLVRSPGTTLAAVLCLGLGIGATTTVYTALRALVLNPVPARDASRLVHVAERPPGAPEGTTGVSPATWLDWRTRIRAFDAVAAHDFALANLAVGELSQRITGHRVSDNFFALLGARAALGRTLLPQDVTSSAAVLVLSDGIWQTMFGGDPAVIGTVARLDGVPHTIVGIMPRDFVFPAGAQYWVPLSFTPAQAESRASNWLEAFARLAPEATIGQARTEVLALEERIAAAYPAVRAEWSAVVEPIQQWHGRNPRQFLIVLLGAVAFVVLIGCVNVANLLLARGSAREREIAIRGALGANRGVILRQFLTESLVLALVAGFAGVLLALWGVYLFRNALPPELMKFNPGWEQIDVDLPALFFTLLVSVATGVLFGVLPALHAARQNAQSALREGGRGSTSGRGRRRLRASLVAAEVALALMLVLGTGLMLRSLLGLMRHHPGFRIERVLTFDVSLPQTKYADPALRATFFDRLHERLARATGVEAAALINVVPMEWADFSTRAAAEAHVGRPESELPIIRTRTATPGLFATLEVPILAGRDFDRGDAPQGRPVVVVSRRMADVFWPGEDALGRRVRLLGDSVWRTVVGIAGDIRHNPNSGQELEMSTLYMPVAQRASYDMSVVVRTSSEPEAFAGAARAVLRELDSDLAPGDLMSMARVRSNAMSPQRVTTAMLGVFAGIALVLAIIGVFGVMSLSVRQRADEIGVRMALGARPRDVLRMVVRDGSRPVFIGVALGLAGGLALSRAVAGLVHDVAPTDPLTFALGTTLLAGVAFAACLLPALRATRFDPARLLRYE